MKLIDPDGQAPILVVAGAIARGAAIGASTSVALNAGINFIAGRPLLENAGREALLGAAIGATGEGVGLFLGVAVRDIQLARAINAARASTNAGTALEGEVAAALGRSVTGFQKTVTVAGKTIGEIDIETSKAIIEVTGASGRKAGQAAKLVENAAMNPEGKLVVVYGPDLAPGAAKAIEETGAKVARTIEELKSLVN